MAVVAAACIRNTVLHHYEPIDENGWNRTDTLQYELPSIPKTGDYQISIGLRYDEQYPYQGLWIVAETFLNNPIAHRRDTLFFQTADEDGQFIGKGVTLLQADTLLTTLHLQEGQNGRIRLRHIMQRETLPGIRDVGVKVCTED